MQDWSLTTDKLLDHAARWHPRREVVSRRPDGAIGRSAYAHVREDAKRLSNGLLARGVRPGDRVATLAMNGVEHLCAWYAISGLGAVCHTLNPRLFEEQLAYIINHAKDCMVMADGAFAHLLARLLPRCPTVNRVIFLSTPTGADIFHIPVEDYVSVLETAGPECSWGGFDERTAAGLCYTSGTTGDPKGVLYSHRSNVLHTFMTLQADAFGFTVQDVVLPMVPMYHANAWGIVFSAPAAGSKLVLPGAQLDGASLLQLITQEEVTVAAGVPTVWLGLVQHMRETGLRAKSLQRAIVGGAPCSERLIRDLKALDVEPMHLWGMTEMSPVGTVGTLTSEIAALPFEAQIPWRVRQGRPPFGVDMKLADEQGLPLPHDGLTAGALHVCGPAVASGYYGDDRRITDGDGDFDTGDIATIDADGFMKITDRAKDVIKSGGEWISSIDVENAALLHPTVSLAAVIAEPHPRWGERPVLFLQLAPGQTATSSELQAFLAERLARWWIPDRVEFVSKIPLGPTGKVDKKVLRATLRDET